MRPHTRWPSRTIYAMRCIRVQAQLFRASRAAGICLGKLEAFIRKPQLKERKSQSGSRDGGPRRRATISEFCNILCCIYKDPLNSEMLPLLRGGVWSLFFHHLEDQQIGHRRGRGLFQHGNLFSSRNTTFTERQSRVVCSSDGQLIKNTQRNVHTVFRKLLASGGWL